MTDDNVNIELPPKLVESGAFTNDFTYIALHGGRGSTKSYSAHLMGAVKGYTEKLRILCVREFQNSLKESSYAQVVQCINSHQFLIDHYEIGESYIRGKNGTEFIFSGLSRNSSSIKSMTDIGLCIVEEAEQISQKSLDYLLPTIRASGSATWFVWNPEMRGSPIDLMFRGGDNPENSLVVELNYNDNPWFSPELEALRAHHERTKPVSYAHVWEGAYLETTETNPFMAYSVSHKIYESPDIFSPKLMHRVISIDCSQCIGKDYFVICEQGRDFQGDTHLIDVYMTNDASLTDRLDVVLRFIERRRPDKLVVERNTDSITFIDVLMYFLKENNVYISIEQPTAASRGNKEDYIVNWLQPVLNESSYYCNKKHIIEPLHKQMFAFNVDNKDNSDDLLDTIASGLRYLKTPKKARTPVVQMTGDPSLDRSRKKLAKALEGKKTRRRRIPI